jgi:AraC-like DNA-binding protein
MAISGREQAPFSKPSGSALQLVHSKKRRRFTKNSTLPHPLHRLEQYQVVLEVVRYFSKHYSEAICIPVMADHLFIPLEQIEFSFDRHRRTTATQALLEYRLNRLCDQMSEDPAGAISKQVRSCGLGSPGHTNAAFEKYFGIDIIDYHKQCFLAAAVRCQERSGGRDCVGDDWVSDLSISNTKETKFHRAQ